MPTENELIMDQNQSEINALKNLLEQTDYISNKVAENSSNRTEYLAVLNKRNNWRSRIDVLQNEINEYTPSFEENKQKKLNEILIYYDNIVNDVIKKGYSSMEIETFDIQRRGANDIISGNTTSSEAEFVTNLATKRSSTNGTTITALELANKIVNNVATAETLKTSALGKQQGQYDLALNATTQTELDNIVLEFDTSTLS